ncbi:MAG: dATP/dGTP diphosphohydrolase domain-containing protein, partial [Polyangia bacterium]
MIDQQFVTKDSGDRREFSTGSVRDRQAGKGRFDLIPLEPLRRLAQLYERGAIKYGESNWQRGQPLMESYFDSALRHLADLKAGEPTEDHCASVLWNVMGFMWTLAEIEAGRLPKELDDRPKPESQYAKAAVPATSNAETSGFNMWEGVKVGKIHYVSKPEEPPKGEAFLSMHEALDRDFAALSRRMAEKKIADLAAVPLPTQAPPPSKTVSIHEALVEFFRSPVAKKPAAPLKYDSFGWIYIDNVQISARKWLAGGCAWCGRSAREDNN